MLALLIGGLTMALLGLTRRVVAGALNMETWENSFGRTLARYMLAAFLDGMGDDVPFTPSMNQVVAAHVADQLAYLSGFRRALEESEDRPKQQARFLWRAGLYGQAPKRTWAEGDVVKQAGRVLPLPAMPCQGTQCGNYCRCRWRIVVIDAKQGDYDAYWERHARDSCQTCIVREQEWSPVKIRGGWLV